MRATNPILAAILTILATALAPDTAAIELIKTAAPEHAPSSNAHAAIQRVWPVELNIEALKKAAKADAISITIADGPTIGAVLTHTSLTATGGTSYRARIPGDLTGYIALTLNSSSMAALISTQAFGLLKIAPVPGGHELRAIDPSYFPGCAADTFPGNAHRAAHSNGSPAQKTPSAPEMDVLVVYTPASRIAVGGVAGMEAKIDLAIDLANTSYANSLIDARLRLVHTEEVHTVRNLHSADFVSLMVDFGDACGITWIMDDNSQGFATRAFCVVDHGCIPGHTFAHKLGHNLGCAHDRDNATGGLFSYSWGWRFTGDNSTLYRTVMSYAPGQRIPHFSHPDITFAGKATGVALGDALESHNALTIINTSPTAADFRPTGDGPGEGEEKARARRLAMSAAPPAKPHSKLVNTCASEYPALSMPPSHTSGPWWAATSCSAWNRSTAASSGCPA